MFESLLMRLLLLQAQEQLLDTGYGFGTALTAKDIEQNASVNRDLKDFIRLNPMVSWMMLRITMRQFLLLALIQEQMI